MEVTIREQDGTEYSQIGTVAFKCRVVGAIVDVTFKDKRDVVAFWERLKK